MFYKILVLILFANQTAWCQISTKENGLREDQLNCILPAYPKNGWYVAPSKPDGKPGSVYSSIYLNVTCDRGHVAKGQTSIFCFQGNWSSPMPECIGHCNLNPHSSVTYYCKQDGEDGLEMECDSIVPSGTVVRAECRKPNYNHEGIHPFMRCIDGVFDYIATCEIECGIITPQGNELISYARDALRAEVPWHVGVYRKLNETPSYQCAASLISTSAIISVAHCYWDHYEKKKKPASNFVVAAGKLYFPWDDPRDEYNAQKRSVKSIDIPSRFHGQNANFQGDIAILIVDKLFELKPYLGPVCLNFDFNFNKRQLRNGNLGKFSGWGYTEEMKQSLALQTVDLPYVGVNECLSLVPKDFEVLVTSDKFCAGYTNGTAVCKGDSGGGISFPETKRGVVRYYLRGVLSVSPSKENNCDLNSLAAYTEVFKHRDFIEESLDNSKWLCHDNTSIQIAMRCNGQVDCPDGSDEAAGMCASTQINMAQNTFFCVLPEYPEHGTYTVEGMPDAKAGMKVLSLRMTVKCDPGFLLQGSETVTCNAGEWSSKIPQCSRECTFKPLLQSPSVEYWCEAPDSGERTAPCEERQPTGSVVRPACKAPFYYSPVSLPLMHCIDGNWDYVPNCVQQCGILAPEKERISAVPYNVTKGELPWHATIYTKRTKPYSALCGGTIVSPTTIISVAHCFWSGTQTLPSSNYVVAVGNLYRTWNHKRDTDVQKIHVKRIKIPKSFRGVINNYQDDIAVVILSEPIVYTRNVLSVCLDFDLNFNSLQLEPGALGKVGGFGLVDTGATRPPPTLKSIDLPYIDITLCIRYAPIQFRECITWDKICAAYSYGTDVCEGDSGGGLVFPETAKQVTLYYLRGILSISPVPAQANEKRVCHKIAVITFTELIRHERFIRENIEIAMPQYKDDDNIKKPDGRDSTVLCNVDEFGCTSGECVDAASICDGKRDCIDGSDESDDACTDDTRAQKPTTTTERSTTKILTHINNDLATVDKCIMPSQPENGVYHVVGCEEKNNKVTFVKLEYSCYKRFAMLEDPTVYCSYGIWSGERFPQCLQTCYLDRHESMNYDCIINGTELTRPCKDFEVEGTVIKPSCKKPNYFTPMELPYMFCRKGQWSSLPTCLPECGTLTPKCAVLVLGGETAKFGDVPWHAGIYHKSFMNGTHVQICGGSLISNSVILSAAHCFWDERENHLHSVKWYSVAVGKLHRDWDDPDDEQIAQKSDVKKIVIPDDYFGNQQNYDYDIAIVIVSGTFQYQTYVRPVCLDFVHSQLYPGAVGMAAGWGLTTGNRGSESPELRIVNMTFVSKSKCRNETLSQYRLFLTHDKFCAGDKEGIALCRGDSGGGLAFPETVFNTVRFYIHGIASTRPPSKDNNLCNTDTFTMFTNIYWYQNLIKKHWCT